jgi:hypothetical protein
MIFYSKYFSSLTFPIIFVQVKKSIFEERDPHLHYYKFYENVKSSGNYCKLAYLNLDKLSETDKDNLKEYLKLNKKADVNRLSYFVINSEGQPMPVFVEEENLESVKRYINGITKFSSLENFETLLSRQSDEAVTIITTGQKTNAFNFVKRFYINSSLFSKNTFNFLINETRSWVNIFNTFNNSLPQDKNEILIMINPKYYKLQDLKNNLNAFVYFNEKLISISEFLSEGGMKNSPNQRFLLCFKFKVTSDDEKEMKNFVDFLENLIDPDSKETRSENTFEFPERYYLTNNLDLANYYKLKFFNNKEKFVFVYLNLQNFNKSNLDVEEATKFFLNTFSKYKNNDNNCNYIITHNPSIAKSFNIIPKSNENIAIRFVDYSSIALFDLSKGSYKLLDNDNIKKTNDHDRNLMFYYKSTYLEKKLNEETFLSTLDKFFKHNDQFKNDNPHYFESYSDYLDDDSFIKNLNGISFKNKILDQPGKKIVLTVSDNCVGCIKTKQILEKISEEKLNKENIKVYEYDTMNESIHFQKIKNNPKLFLFENNKLISEIDAYKILESPLENNSETIEKEIRKMFKI